MSASPPRSRLGLTPLALGAGLAISLSGSACGSGSYGVRTHYQSPEPEPAPAPAVTLVSAHLTRFGVEPAPIPDAQRARMVEGGEHTHDELLLVFAEQLDPLTLDPRAFGILRADGRRVRPVRAFLAPADEGDENRSVTLLGNFGSEEAPPVAVHVLGPLYAETGADLRGLDADITPPSEPDRPVVVERLKPDERRCPGAVQVIRSYWTDTLAHVGADDLAGIELRLADGRVLHPVEFDDQARREGEEPCGQPFAACLGPADDNVLDLCIDSQETVLSVRFAAGLFRDAGGRPSAAAEVSLTAAPVPKPES